MAKTVIRKRHYERELVDADIAIGAAIALSKIANSGNLLQRDGSVMMAASFNMNGNRIINVADPVNPQDAATKAYVDATIQGLDVKGSVRAATTANITLSGTQTIDAVALSVGDRVLVKNQTTTATNGIYVVQAGAWVRADDANTNTEVTPGMFTFVQEGTANQNSGWVLTTNGTITLGTTGLDFQQFSGAGQIDAGAGLTKTGNTLNVIGTAGRIVVNADSIDLATVGTAGADPGITLTTVDVYGRVTSRAAATTSHLTEGSNLYFTTGRVLGTTLSGLPVVTGKSTTLIAAADTVLNAFAKLQTQINDKQKEHVNLNALSGIAGAAGQNILPYLNGIGTMTSVTLSALALNLLDDATTGAMQLTLGLRPGTEVQAYNVGLKNLADTAGTATVGFLKSTGVNTWSIDNTTYMVASDGLRLDKIRTRESLVGTQDGVNGTFTLALNPVAGTEHVFVDGALMYEGAGNDYTINYTTKTIVFDPAPYSTSIVQVSYIAQ